MRTVRFVSGAIALVVLLALVVIAADSARPAAALVDPDPAYQWNDDDNCPDIIDSFDSQPRLWKGDCTGANWSFSPSVVFVLDDVYDRFLMPGDWNFDDCSDLIALKGSGLFLIEGDCVAGVGDITQMPGDFSGFDYFLAPGGFSQDINPDLMARRSEDGALMILRGDGQTGFIDPAGEIIGSDFDVYDIIMGPLDFSGDGCFDVMGRRKDDGKLMLHLGGSVGDTCNSVLSETPTEVVGAADLAEYDWLFSGGDWIYEQGTRCPDIAAWKESDPGNLYFYRSDCAGNISLPPKVVNNPINWVYPFGGDSVRPWYWGDSDCNGAVAPRDAQAGLKHFLAQPAISVTEPCPSLGDVVYVAGDAWLWGDWDCNGAVAPRDSQSAVRHFLEFPPLSQEEFCPPVGTSVPLSRL
jgi:hypothetical protein